jgi:hypothetical protein
VDIEEDDAMSSTSLASLALLSLLLEEGRSFVVGNLAFGSIRMVLSNCSSTQSRLCSKCNKS